VNDADRKVDHLMNKADALIRRHRTFVASPTPATQPAHDPALSLPVLSMEPPEEDVPVLTEVVDEDMARQGSAAVMVDSALTDQQRVIRAAIERWVDEALPEAILHVLDGFTDRLIAAVSDRARQDLLASLEHDALGNRSEHGTHDPT
jgi:hypothetical protein